MRSNQERSYDCLPPKKREILAQEERQVLVGSAVSESQSGENLAWLASVAAMARMASAPKHAPPGSGPAEGASTPPSAKPPAAATGYLPSTSVCNSSLSAYMSSTPKGSVSVTSTITANPAVLPSGLAHTAGPIPHAQLPPNIQIIGPYTGYISSQIVPAAGASPTQSCRGTQEVYATTAVIPQAPNGNLQKHHMVSSLPSAAHTSSQCIQVEGASVGLTVTSPSTQLPLQLHPHSAVLAPHGLALAPSQLLLHYADGLITKHSDSHSRDSQNGALGEMVKHGAGVAKESSNKPESDDSHRQNQNLGLQAQTQVLLPADYATHDGAGLQTSLMLVSGSHLLASNSTELQSSLDKDQSSLARVERTGLSVGKPVSRVSSLTLSSADSLAAPLVSSHALLQTSPCAATQELSTSLYSTAQLPIIGYITSTSGGPQQVMASYHSNLPQHLVISSNPSLLIPVSAGNINTSSSDAEVTHCSVSSIPANVPTVATGLPQAYITTATPAVAASVAPNDKEVAACKGHHAAAPVQGSSQVQLPVLPGSLAASPTPALTPASSSPQNTPLSPSSALPPYFMKGSIIQLADGGLKRVEDLRAEDFLQSADLSGELKIDSSTVERIHSSRTPDAVIIQFSVGEHKAQVCVEVLVEYPFFVFGQGWSSCCPDRTTQLLALSCAKLSVGDVCISLTLKSLRNGALRKDQTFGSVLNHNTNHVKATKTKAQAGAMPDEREDMTDGNRSTAEGGPKQESPGLQTLDSEEGAVLAKDGEGQPRGAGGRKRRWSAPERGEMGKPTERGLPETAPKMSFLSQEEKVSIEGKSSIGS